MDEERLKTLRVWVLILFVLSLVFQGIRVSMVKAAQRQVEQTASKIALQASNFDQLKRHYEKAKGKHLAIYVQKISLQPIGVALAEAQRLRIEATQASHPNDKRSLAAQAAGKLTNLGGLLSERQSYLNLLDRALALHQSEPQNLTQGTNQARNYMSGLEKAGYFPANFLEPRQLLAAADQRLKRSHQLLREKLEKNSPDYLGVYLVCLEGERFAKDSKKLTEAIPALRLSNESRLANLPDNAPEVKRGYEQAWMAANQLESYPNYRILDMVKDANNSFTEIQNSWEIAKDQNSMAKQEFELAAQNLAKAEEILAKANETFSKAINSWEEVQSAIRQNPGARRSAQKAISRAKNEIDDWSENDQSEAEDLLRKARDQLASGDLRRQSDPPSGLRYYHSAKSSADEAYEAVDTHRHTSSSPSIGFGGSSDSGSSGSYGGYGGGGGYSGGGSSGGGSGGGGGYGGPSGGGYGGPSGGGYGSGGF